MRKIYIIAVLCMSLSSFGQIVNIPDANFKNALVNTPCIDTDSDGYSDSDADLNNDGEIQISEAEAPTNLRIISQNVSNAEGLQSFTSLRYLQFENNLITSLPVSTLSQLQGLSCSNNQIATLDVSGLTELATIQCSSNQMTSMQFNNNTALFFVRSEGNLFTTLDFCSTSIRHADLSGNALLTYLSVKNNIITEYLVGDRNSQGPPPLPPFILFDCNALETICYDEGEFGAVQWSAEGENVTFTTDCNCELLSNSAWIADNIQMWPVPAKDKIEISADFLDAISIFNTSGQQLISQKFHNVNTAAIDLQGFNAGIYYISISSSKGKVTKKLIKE